MNAKRRPSQLRLTEGTDDTPHYHGHRERLRQRLIAAGADNLPDYELLEVILFASNARADVKPLAKNLLERFGGFAELLSADPDALTAAGLGLAGVAALKAARPAAVGIALRQLRLAVPGTGDAYTCGEVDLGQALARVQDEPDAPLGRERQDLAVDVVHAEGAAGAGLDGAGIRSNALLRAGQGDQIRPGRGRRGSRCVRYEGRKS